MNSHNPDTHSAQRGTAVCGTTTRHSRRLSARAAAFAAALAVLGPAAAFADGPPAAAQTASVTCAAPGVPMYHVDGADQLRRWSYASPLTGTSGWTQAEIGTGWAGLGVISGGDGVIYTIDSSGDLHCIRTRTTRAGPRTGTRAAGTSSEPGGARSPTSSPGATA